MNNTAAAFETTQGFPSRAHDVALTETARLAVSVNSKHREVQRLGRTAKEIAAEIGEELIKVKAQLKHGEFIPWIAEHCMFTRKRGHEYMKVAEAKCNSRVTFDRCDSIREVLALGKAPKEPPQQTRPATLDDLDKVASLRALRDCPAASVGERENAAAKLAAIEREIGKVDVDIERAKKRLVQGNLAKQAAEIVMSGVFRNPKALDLIQFALQQTYGDDEERLKRLVDVLIAYKAN